MAGNKPTGSERGTASAANTVPGADNDGDRLPGTLDSPVERTAAPTPKLIEQADLEKLRETGAISDDFMQVLLDMQAEERTEMLARKTGGGLGAGSMSAAHPAPEED